MQLRTTVAYSTFWFWKALSSISPIVGVCLHVLFRLLLLMIGYSFQGQSNGLIVFFDPLSYGPNGKATIQWLVYGTLYTLAIIVFFIKVYAKILRQPVSTHQDKAIIFSYQIGFAFLLPELLAKLNRGTPYFAKDLKIRQHFW